MNPLESQESSSPIVTRAVAAGLQDQYIDNYIFPGWQKVMLTMLGALPQSAARFAISRFQTLSGLPAEVLDRFSIDHLVQARLDDYAQSSGTFPAVLVGAALGGATTYLSLALGAAFLPQAFVITLRGGAPDGDARRYVLQSRERALQIARENPGLITIQHFDPVHDGWLTRFVNHLRFKLIDLPPAYADFLRKRLDKNGTVVFLEGGAQWLRYRLGVRSFLQVGGWGGISPEEFTEGSPRLRAYAKSAGLKYSQWKLPDLPIEQGPESEWGSEPGLGMALQDFCQREGYRFVCLQLPHPNDFSRLAFHVARKLLDKEGRPPSGVLVEMFSQFDASAARKSSLLPLWLIFNTQDSLTYLKEMKELFPAGCPVFFSPLATFSITPDLVPWKEWEAALEGLDWINVGARSSHYPADARALVNWVRPLRRWVADHPQPIQSRINIDEMTVLAKQL